MSSSTASRFLTATVLFAAVSCVSAPRLAPETAPVDQVIEDFGLTDWRHARVGGYEVFTNASPERVHASLVRIERFTQLVGRFIFGSDFRNPNASIIIFRSQEEFAQFGGDMAAGHAWTTRESASLATHAGSTGAIMDVTLNHELVHIVTGSNRNRQFPRWFTEGFAVFFQGAMIRGDVATIGQRPPADLGQIRNSPFKKPLPLKRLFSIGTSMQGDVELYYATSWLFVHYGLLSDQLGGPRRVEQFWKLVDLLGEKTQWRDAFAEAFDVSLAEVEAELETHRQRVIANNVIPQGNIIVEMIEPEYDFVSLSSPQAARQLADHTIHIGGTNKLVASLLEVILQESPEEIAALHDRTRVAARRRNFALADQLFAKIEGLDVPTLDRIPELTRAVVAHERYRAIDPRERSESGSEHVLEAQRNYRDVLNRFPQRSETWVELGNTYVLDESGAPEAGIEALTTALRLGIPFDMYARLDLAKLLLRAHDLVAARPHLDYVIEGYSPFREADEARKLIRRYY